MCTYVIDLTMITIFAIRNLEYAQEIVPGDSKSLLTSKYNKWHFPVILIHGYGQNYSTSFPQLTKDGKN